MRKKGFCVLLISGATGFWAAPVYTADLTLDERMTRLERRLQALPTLVTQLESLQREISELRGELETQAHKLRSLEKRQRDLYLDIDSRLSRSQGAGSAAPAGQSALGTGGPNAAPTPESAEPSGPVPEAQSLPSAVARTAGDPAAEERSYQKAFGLLREGHYEASITAFREFLERYPAGDYADNAQYWLGEASYVTRAFDTALKEFEAVIARYPASPKVSGALLKTGYIHYEKQQWKQARQVLQQLIENYPGSTESRLAAQRLERMRTEGH